MTTPPVQPPAVLNPPDLRAAHLAQVRTFRIGQGVAIAVLALLGLVLGLVAWGAAGGGASGVAVGAVAFLLFLLVLAIPMAISAVKERNLGGPAGRGPSAFGQVLTTAPADQAWQAVYAVLQSERFGPPRPTDPQTVVATRSLSMSSWGETMTVRIEGSHDGRGLVTAWSRPIYPLQWVDYGRNRRFANAILNAVPAAEPVRQPH